MARVVIVGGGLTGMFTAYYLVKDGHEVTVVDENLDRGSASVFNAGFLMPSAGAAPTISLSKIFIQNVSRSGPIYISTAELLRNIRWFRIARRKGLRGFEEAISSLGNISLQLYRNFLAEEGVDIDYHPGIMSLYRDERVARQMAIVSKSRFVEADEILRMGFRNLGGGCHSEHEASVNPPKLFGALRESLKARGVRMLLDTRASISNRQGHVTSVTAGDQTLTADHYIIAAGSQSRKICHALGFNFPMLPARGVALVLDTHGREIIRAAALIEDDGISVSQHNLNTIRVTSLFEMVGFSLTISDSRINWMMEHAAKYIPALGECTRSGVGIGFRPCTPDQLPVIGRVPSYDNLYIATGNCRLGVTLAPATANAISMLIGAKNNTTVQMADDELLRHFDPKRFA